MRKLMLILIGLFFVLPPSISLSDIYTYTDKNGLVHFTNVTTNKGAKLYLKEVKNPPEAPKNHNALTRDIEALKQIVKSDKIDDGQRLKMPIVANTTINHEKEALSISNTTPGKELNYGGNETVKHIYHMNSFVYSFILTYGIGLLPPLLIRFVILRRPIRYARWGVVIVACFWVLNALIFTAMGSTNKTHGVLFIIGWISYAILRKSSRKGTNPQQMV